MGTMSDPSVSEVARENQRTLLETQQKLALALQATELGLWSWDSETNQIVWDERMRVLHGYDEPLVPREYSEKLVHPEDRHLLEALFLALPSGTFPQTSYRIVRPDGSVRWLLLVGQATLDESGRLRRVMGGSLDVTRQRELEEQLRKSQKMTAITSLTAGIAHNFNNMLAVILPILEFAVGLVPRQHQRLLHDATHAAQRAAELVEQLMTYAGHSTTSHRRKVCDVDELVRAAVSICRRAFDAHIQVKIKQSGMPLSVACNPGQVEQVIVNLLLNARDAINEANLEKGVITVRVRASADTASVSQGFVCIDVSDNGGGLSAEARAHLFEPFFTTKAIGKGTGLGLATSYAIARDHGGLLTCPSSSRRGTQFTLRLPLDPSSALEAAAPLPHTKLDSGTRLLLVDDDDAVRTTLQSVLSAQGNVVFQADSGAEALEQLRVHPDVQVILLDRSMPGGHGETFIPALRALAPKAPIVFVSGYSIDAELAALVDAVVMKPVTGSTLSRVIQQVLSGKKA
jgi:PAS domain S-box-containing protein